MVKRIMETKEIRRLEALVSFEKVERKTNAQFDLMSDVNILKAFNLPANVKDTELYEKSLVKRLLTDRENRPSTDVWNEFYNLAKSNDLQAADAAELYFFMKDKYPIRDDSQPADAPPNIVGDAMGSFGLMADGGGNGEDKDKDKDCD